MEMMNFQETAATPSFQNGAGLYQNGTMSSDQPGLSSESLEMGMDAATLAKEQNISSIYKAAMQLGKDERENDINDKRKLAESYGILGKKRGNELEKRIIKAELLTNWLRQKQIEEEVLRELFGKDMFDMVRNSLFPSDNPKATEETSNKPLTDMHKRDEPVIQGRQSLNTAQDHHFVWLGNHAQAGGTDGLPFQHPHLRAKNNANGKMVLDFSIRNSTPPTIVGKDASETKRKIESPIEEQGDKPASDERKKQKNQYECEVCQLETTSEEQLRMHLSGKKHLLKEKASVKSNKM